MKRSALVVLCLFAAAPAVFGQGAGQGRATVVYLTAFQTSDGGFGESPAGAGSSKSSLRLTSSAARALKYFGGDVPDPKAASAFVASCFDKESGGFADRPGGKPDVATTAVGLMAVAALKMPAEPYAEPAVAYLAGRAKTFEEIRIAAAGLEAAGKRPAAADAWLKEVAKLRRDDGSYGDGGARDTGGAAVVVLRLGGTLAPRDAVLKTIRTGQRGDGGFGKTGAKGSELETTYRVMRCFMMLKGKPADVAGLRAFVAKCRNADGGYGVAPGEKSSTGGTYYAGSVLHWLGE